MLIYVKKRCQRMEKAMMRKKIPPLFILCALLLLTGCNLPMTLQETPTLQATETPLPSETPTPSVTPTETPTTTPTLIPTETNTPEPLPTPTVEIPVAEVFRETNCRTGPAGNYDLVVIIAPGTEVEVIGADLGPQYYWYIRNPENPERGCWLLAQNMKVSGDTSSLPAFTPMPSPTLSAGFRAEYRRLDTCKDDFFARFVVTNTGGVQFRSAYIKLTNTKTNEVVEQSWNAFDLTEGCIIARNIAPLLPGQTGYLDSPRFKKDPRGQRFNVVIMACTEQNLKGDCATQVIEARP
jgi:hypothetical protein